jgi:hypothetical protein
MSVYLISSPEGHLTETFSPLEAFEGCDLHFPFLRDSLKSCKAETVREEGRTIREGVDGE